MTVKDLRQAILAVFMALGVFGAAGAFFFLVLCLMWWLEFLTTLSNPLL